MCFLKGLQLNYFIIQGYDKGTIDAIKQNIYMQYFLGLPSFKPSAVFAPSLFVEIRKRLGLDYWNEINDIIVKHNLPNKKR